MSRIIQQPLSMTAIPSDVIGDIEDLRRVDSLSINHGFSFRQGLIDKRIKYFVKLFS